MIENAWAGIDPAQITDGTLTMADMERYWTTPSAKAGARAACCNCERIASIVAFGVCRDCHTAAKSNTGADLLNALAAARGRFLPVAEPDQADDEETVKAKVIGKIDLPPPIKPQKKIHVESEDGTDLGTLTAFASRMAASDSMAAAGGHGPISLPVVAENHLPIVPKVSRALIVEVGESEIEFRVRQGGMDIKVDDGTGCIWMVQGIGPEILMDLYSMAKHAMEASNV